MFDKDNIVRIRFQMQLRSPRGDSFSASNRAPASYCRCSRYSRQCDPGPIKRGEAVIWIKRRTNVHTNSETGEKKPYYETERWRIECFAENIKLLGPVFAMKNVVPPYKWEMKRDRPGAPTSLKEIWNLTDQQIQQRAKLQRRVSTYKVRLNKYKTNLEPTERTLKAIENCKVKIAIAETALKAQLTTEAVMKSGFQEEETK